MKPMGSIREREDKKSQCPRNEFWYLVLRVEVIKTYMPSLVEPALMFMDLGLSDVI